jgi:hypothetical protein
MYAVFEAFPVFAILHHFSFGCTNFFNYIKIFELFVKKSFGPMLILGRSNYSDKKGLLSGSKALIYPPFVSSQRGTFEAGNI